MIQKAIELLLKFFLNNQRSWFPPTVPPAPRLPRNTDSRCPQTHISALAALRLSDHFFGFTKRRRSDLSAALNNRSSGSSVQLTLISSPKLTPKLLIVRIFIVSPPTPLGFLRSKEGGKGHGRENKIGRGKGVFKSEA